MESRIYSRKEFIKKCLNAGSIFYGSVFALSACSSEKQDQKTEKSTPESCDDLSGVSKSERKKRESFGYVKKSTVSGSHCSNCKLYLPPAEGESCGGCLLFDGPVRAEGYCTQYEAQS